MEDEEIEITEPEDGTVTLPTDLAKLVDDDENKTLEDDDTETTEEGEEEENTTEDDNSETEDVTDDEDNSFTDRDSLLKALNQERKLRKQAEAKAKAKATSEKVKSAYEQLIESGVDKDIAKTISNISEQSLNEIAKLKFDNELITMSKRSGFEDIEEYSEDVKNFMDKGLTMEQAYYAVTGGNTKKTRTTKAEIQRQVEAKMQNQAKRKKALDIDTNGFEKSDKVSKKNYSSLELALAKRAGISIEDYEAYKNITSVNEDSAYRTKKK